jgi:hypothetical protein
MYQFVRKWKARGELLTTRQVLTLRFSVVPKVLVEQSLERWNCLLSYLSTRLISLNRLLYLLPGHRHQVLVVTTIEEWSLTEEISCVSLVFTF